MVWHNWFSNLPNAHMNQSDLSLVEHHHDPSCFDKHPVVSDFRAMPGHRIGVQYRFSDQVDNKKYISNNSDRKEMHPDEPCSTTRFECLDPEGFSSLRCSSGHSLEYALYITSGRRSNYIQSILLIHNPEHHIGDTCAPSLMFFSRPSLPMDSWLGLRILKVVSHVNLDGRFLQRSQMLLAVES